ncbi:MAG: GrpB family protein [Bacteroidota bacterium]
MTLPEFPRSSAVAIIPYQTSWPQEYEQIASQLSAVLQDAVLRIDHIGSTSVPGLSAKDIIDIQITVANLDDTVYQERLNASSFVFRGANRDNFIDIPDEHSPELRKCYAREIPGQKRTHIHIREHGRLNQRYALLFRDYLRASDPSRLAYQTIKERLAILFPESIEGYLYIKDPVMDLMYVAAESWATQTHWEIGPRH